MNYVLYHEFNLDARWYEPTSENDGQDTRLDPILVARCLDISRVVSCNGPFSNMPFMNVCRERLTNGFSPLLTSQVDLPQQNTTAFEASFASLVEWRVACRISQDSKVTSRYFEVEKKERLTRAILDLRVLNDSLPRPPPLRLVTPADLVSLFCFFGPRASIATFDMRHWFYQFGLHHGDQNLVVFSCGRHRWKFCCLPMGLSWSPFIAQSALWGMLLANTTWMTISHGSWNNEGPPAFVELQKNNRTFAIVALLYDNVAVIADCSVTRDVIIKKMKTNLDHCHAIIKDEIVLDDGKYLGIDFRLKDDGLTWSHLESNISRWSKWPHPSPQLTKKEFLRYGGVLLWDAIVRGEFLTHLRWLILWMSDLGSRDMDQVMLAPRELNSAWKELLISKPQFRRYGHSIPDGTIFACSDACLKGWGIIIWRNGAVEEYCGEWEESRQGLHINTLETIVACDAVRRCGTDAYIVLGVDNTTAISAIKRRMHENILIHEAVATLGEAHILVVHIPTAVQAADPLSRGEEMDPSRNRETLRILECEELIRRGQALKKRSRND